MGTWVIRGCFDKMAFLGGLSIRHFEGPRNCKAKLQSQNQSYIDLKADSLISMHVSMRITILRRYETV